MARMFKFKEITQAEILKGRLEEIGTVLIQRSKGPEEVLPTGDLVGQYLFEDEEGNYLDPRSIVDSDDVAIVFVNGKVIADTGHSERVKEQEPFPEIPETIVDLTSDEFATTSSDTSITLTLVGGIFKEEVVISDFDFEGTNAEAFAQGTVERKSETEVEIGNLTLVDAEDNIVTIKASALEEAGGSVTVIAS